MSGDTTFTITSKLTMLDIHTIFQTLTSCREVTIRLGAGVHAPSDWHEIELLIIAAHEARIRMAGDGSRHHSLPVLQPRGAL